MPRLIGVAELLIGDDADNFFALKNAALSISTASLEHANIGDLGWSASAPDLSGWTVSASANAFLKSDGFNEDSHAALEALAFAKTEFGLRFTAPNGASYIGLSFVSSLVYSSADQKAFGFSVVIQGIRPLVKLADVLADWCPTQRILTSYWSLPSPVTPPIAMGLDDGWVKIKDAVGGFGSAGGHLSVFYDDVLVHFVSNFGDTCGGGAGEETFFFYAPDGGGPFTLLFIQEVDVGCGTPFSPETRVDIWCPGVEEPMT